MLGGCDLVRMRGRGGTLDCVWERGLGDGLGFEVDGFFREVGGNYRQMMQRERGMRERVREM